MLRKTVFVSYRASDIDQKSLYEVRQAVGENAFFPDRDIRSGDNWNSQIQHELQRSHALVLLMGPNWLRHADEYGRRLIDFPNDYIRREIQTAIDLGVNVIPVLMDRAAMPPVMALPDELQFLAKRKFIRQSQDESWLRNLYGVLQGSREGTIDETYRINPQDYEVLNFELQNFKCFDRLSVDLDISSVLTGNWSCIAGINGAGKTSILQALALLLMGPRMVREIGGKRLDAFRRRDEYGSPKTAVLRADLRAFNRIYHLEMTIGESGADTTDTEFWSVNGDALFVGYGAGRNVSSSSNRRENELSFSVDRFISLFDPMARLNSAESLFSGNHPTERGQLEEDIFIDLVGSIFPQEMQPKRGGKLDPIEFRSGEALHSVWDLPDGYRSSAAWLADLASCIADQNKKRKKVDIRQVGGIVLIDELELHLHASLQRSIVPRLREALPGVQWIVTTHSPLVLASFDRNELVALDEDFSNGLKKLDRQILGLTADQIYQYLFDTPASSEAAELHLAKFPDADLGSQEVESILNDPSENYDAERFKKIQARLRKLQN